jgi:effector-binding domain-containing protein
MKTKPMILIVVAAIVGSSFASVAGALGRDRYETPKYEVTKKSGSFEVREYPALTVASATMGADTPNKNSAFMNLFRYISGDNEKGQKIEMTSPVFTSPTQKAGQSVMSFVVPADVAKAGAPKATDSNIVITKRAAGKFAVYRYTGRWTESREKSAREKLAAWAKSEGMEIIGDFEKANYDPPFVPPFLRRNEALVRIKG